MKKQIYSRYMEVDYPIDIDISLLNSRIYTTEAPNNLNKEEEEEEVLEDIKEELLNDYPDVGEIAFGAVKAFFIQNIQEKNKNSLEESNNLNEPRYLRIDIEVLLESYESIIDGAAFARPRLLIILGILTFITKKVLTPFEFQGTSKIGELDLPQTEKFFFEGKDLTNEFNLIKKITLHQNEGKKRLFYSLIDRWRKALYFELEGNQTEVYEDEILLSFFHILELLASEYYKMQKIDAKNLIKNFTANFVTQIYLSEGLKLQNELKEKTKLIDSLLLGSFSVKSKILFMLKKQGLLNSRLKDLINILVNDRNAVAHGRQVYQDKIIYPVPAFFPLVKYREYDTDILKTLTGRVIAKFIDSNLFEEDWNEVNYNLFPTYEEVKLFIQSKEYQSISNESFCSEKKISPYVIGYYLLRGKIKPQEGLIIFEEYMQKYSSSEMETYNIILASIILIDYAKENQKENCLKIIETAFNNSWIPLGFVKMRDLLYFLNYHKIKAKTLKFLIEENIVK